MASASTTSSGPIKAVFFDYMGTCLDWHSAVTAGMPPGIPALERSALALTWRQQYFAENAARVAGGGARDVEDFDTTMRRALRMVLLGKGHDGNGGGDREGRFRHLARHFYGDADDSTATAALDESIAAWHRQRAWHDVPPALAALRAPLRDNGLGLELFVHANGSTRLQLDNTRASGLAAAGTFELLMSSQLLGAYMPSPESYAKGLELAGLKPSQVVKVAAHAYDLRGARDAGMRTIYVRRWTDDIEVDKDALHAEFDAVVDDFTGLVDAITALQK